MARPEKIRLGDLLISQGLLTDEQLKMSLDEQKRSGRKLGRIFVDSGYVTEEGISKALAGQLRIPFIDLKQFNPKQELIKLLPEAQARRFHIRRIADGVDHLVQILERDQQPFQNMRALFGPAQIVFAAPPHHF